MQLISFLLSQGRKATEPLMWIKRSNRFSKHIDFDEFVLGKKTFCFNTSETTFYNILF